MERANKKEGDKYKTIDYSFLEILLEQTAKKTVQKKWKDVRGDRNEVLKHFVRKVISLHLNREFLKDKTYQKEYLVWDFGKVKLALKYRKEENVECFLERIKPRLKIVYDKKARKPVVLAEILQQGQCKKQGKTFKITLTLFKVEGNGETFLAIATYLLTGNKNHKKFSITFGYVGGEIVSRISPELAQKER